VRAYLIALAVIALLIGSLFQAAEATGVRVMRMFGTMGIAFFGIVATMMIVRWQSRTGLGDVERAIKSLEPEGLITDWAFQGRGRPDYLVVAPAGIIAICLDETAQAVREKKAVHRIGKGRERVKESVRWLRDRMGTGLTLGDGVTELKVGAYLVLLRRKARPEDSADDVAVVNPEELAERLAGFRAPAALDQQARIKLTRHFRDTGRG
jgi:hypothetical protein